jgi:hypothetical protein
VGIGKAKFWNRPPKQAKGSLLRRIATGNPGFSSATGLSVSSQIPVLRLHGSTVEI